LDCWRTSRFLETVAAAWGSRRSRLPCRGARTLRATTNTRAGHACGNFAGLLALTCRALVAAGTPMRLVEASQLLAENLSFSLTRRGEEVRSADGYAYDA